MGRKIILSRKWLIGFSVSCFFSCVLFFITEHSHNILEVFMGDHVNKIWSAEHSLRKIFFLKKQRKVLFYFIFILFLIISVYITLIASCISCTVLSCPLSPIPFFIYSFPKWIFIMSQIYHLHKIKIVMKENLFSNFFIFYFLKVENVRTCKSRNLIKKIISSKKSDFYCFWMWNTSTRMWMQERTYVRAQDTFMYVMYAYLCTSERTLVRKYCCACLCAITCSSCTCARTYAYVKVI